MGALAEAFVRVRADTTGFQRDAERDMHRSGQSGGKRFGAGMSGALGGVASKVFAPLAAAVAGVGIVSFFKGAVEGASDTAESMSKVGVVFGKSAGQVKAFASTAATNLGLSQQAALEAAGSLGNLFVALKLPQTAAAGMSTKMVTLAGDLASFNNVPVEDALAALKSGLVGETEPLRAFGVNMNDATLRTQAMKDGLIKSTKDAMSPAVKAQAAYALILAQTGTAQGDFARTSSGLANQQRILGAKFTDLKAKIGAQLLPAFVGLAQFATSKLLPGLERLGGVLSSTLGPVFARLGGYVQAFFSSFSSGGATMARSGTAGTLQRIGLVVRDEVLPALRRFGEYVRDTVIPVIQRIYAQVIPAAISAFNSIRASIQANRPELEKLWAGFKKVVDFVVTRVLPVMGPIMANTYRGMAIIIGNTISTIAFLVRAFQTLSATVTAVVARIRAVWQAFWSGPFGAAARAGFSLLVSVVRIGVSLVMASVRTIAAVAAIITAPFRAAASGVSAAIGTLVRLTGGIRGRIASSIGDMAGLLYRAGRAVVEGLINGIASKLTGLASIAKKLADTIARVLPGSPVREGPLTVLNRGYAGGRIATMLADGINARAGTVNAAMRSAVAIPGIGVPAFAGSPATTAGGSGDLVGALVAALSLMSWQIDPQGVARLVATGNRTLARRL